MRALAATGLLCALACAHPSASAGPGPSEAARYFPLAVGNRWSYQSTGLGTSSVEQVEIVAIHDGQYQDSRGRRLWVSPDGLRDQTRVLLRTPVEVGRTWSVRLGADSVEHWRITSVGEQCSAPAGTFPDCVVAESQTRAAAGAELVNRITFAAGVGIVRVRTTLSRNGTETPQTELQLTAYRVAH